MKSILYIFYMLFFLSACQQNTPKENQLNTNQKPIINLTAEEFNQFLYKEAEMLPGVDIDSIIVTPPIYKVYITDTSISHLNAVNIQQHVAIILKIFGQITFSTVSFNRIQVFYQLPLRDSTGYIIAYNVGLEQTKEWLKLFNVIAFDNIIKDILVIHKDYPKEHVLDLLNMTLALVVAEEEKSKVEWFGINFMELVSRYSFECEGKNGDYGKGMLDKVLDYITRNDKAHDLKILKEITAKIRTTFEKNCKLLEERPAQKVEEKIIAL